MKIISKRQAMTIYRQHPHSRLFRFCTGKYQWSGSICHYVGREVQDIAGKDIVCKVINAGYRRRAGRIR